MVCKKQTYVISSKISEVFLVSTLGYAGPSLIQFRLKGDHKSKSVFKRVAQVVSSYLFDEIFTKRENIVSSHSEK